MADRLHTLTVQDVIWANRQITGRDVAFHQTRLEEATFNQYAYGGSLDVSGQAARFLRNFPRFAPFDAGNEATAFLVTLAFLELNGHHVALKDEEGAAWLAGFRAGGPALPAADADGEHESPRHGPADTRATLRAMLDRYPRSIASLAA